MSKTEQTIDIADKGLASIKEACDYLALSRTTLAKLINRGDIETIRLGTRDRRVVVASMQNWINQNAGGVIEL